MPVYDLEERTLQFAIRVRAFTKKLPRTTENIEDIRQLTRASASIGANYIEANESLGEKDKRMKIKISRKESKEARFFSHLIDTADKNDLEVERKIIITESTELMNIFGAILRKLG
ncbi:hypothetical protein BH11BAC1_BH11BAC1_29510 [soil metagenome]